MKLNLKSTIAAPADHNSCQGALNGIIGNTRHGIVVDKTLDPDSNNPVANKPVSTALAALAGQLAKGQVVFLDQLPERGEPHKIYVLTTTNQRYWWNGSAFIKIVPTASETNVPPTLNLLDMSTDDTPTVRTSITEEEKQNIEKGLYNSVLYADYSLGENGFYSTYFPENAIYANGNFIFSIYRLSYDKTSQSFSIISTRVYGITIGEKNSDGTYPIEIQRELEAPFSGSGSIGSSNDISHRLNLMNEDLSAVRTSITEEEKNNISKGLYHSVLYIDSSLGETASMSYRLPENAFHSNVNDRFGFSIYKVASNNSITGARIYELRIGEQGSDGTYPITVSKITDLLFGGDNLLQKPSGLTKTELVGVGTNGQENIEIGDNLTLANGKLSATGGSSGGDPFETITISDDWTTYEGTFTGTKPVILKNEYGGNFLYTQVFSKGYISPVLTVVNNSDAIQTTYTLTNGEITEEENIIFRSHFITITDSASNVALYITIQNTSGYTFTADTLASYLAGKKVLANGNLHGVVPTYIAGEGGVIKIYYRTPGDSNINPTPDEYQDLSSFTITDDVTPVE